MLEVQNLRKMSQFTTRPIQWWIPTLDELSIWVELCTSRPTRQYAPAFESQVLFCFFCFVLARYSVGSWISTPEVSTWPSLTTRTRLLRAKPTTSASSGPTTSSILVGRFPGALTLCVKYISKPMFLQMLFSQAPFSSYLLYLLSRFRPLAPERQCGENVEIFKELHHHQGTVDRRCVRLPLLASPPLSKPIIVSVLSSVRTSSSLTPPTSFECFACWLNTNQVGWKTSRLSPCTIAQRGNTQIPSLSDIRQ